MEFRRNPTVSRKGKAPRALQSVFPQGLQSQGEPHEHRMLYFDKVCSPERRRVLYFHRFGNPRGVEAFGEPTG